MYIPRLENWDLQCFSRLVSNTGNKGDPVNPGNSERETNIFAAKSMNHGLSLRRPKYAVFKFYCNMEV